MHPRIRAVAVAPAGHVNDIESRRLQNPGEPAAFLRGYSLLVSPLLAVHSHADDEVSSNPRPYRADDFRCESRPCFQRLASVIVVAAVPRTGEEAIEKIRMSGVHLDTVEA